MAKDVYIGVNGIARKVASCYIGVNGVARKVKAGYIGVNGVARKFLDGSPSLEPILIYDNTDWESFVAQSDGVKPGQRVDLMADIDCGGATYNALTFAGDFNGNNYTISNATFSAVDGNSGMFVSIGPGQIIADLVLDGITVENGTNAGILAGTISGEEGNRALIQNVQVKNSSVVGCNAGGIAGYVSDADVKYCSSRDTSIDSNGMDGGGGGVAGISYGSITDCYSTCTPTALLSIGRGGIAGKNLEGGTVTYCWCTYSQEAGTTTDATTQNNLPSVTSSTNVMQFARVIRDASKWNTLTGTDKDFITTAVTYTF